MVGDKVNLNRAGEGQPFPVQVSTAILLYCVDVETLSSSTSNFDVGSCDDTAGRAGLAESCDGDNL